PPRNGGRKHVAAVVVRVLADQVDPAGRFSGGRRRAAEEVLESGITHRSSGSPAARPSRQQYTICTTDPRQRVSTAIESGAGMFALGLEDFEKARARIAEHIKRTPLLTSRQLSERSGFDVRLKAEMFQRVGSYKIRGPLNKFALMP